MPRLPPAVEEVVRRYSATLHEELGDRVQRVVVFGSQARGDATEDSDVDVLVVLDRLTHEERTRAMNLLIELGFERDLVAAPVVLSAAAWEEMVQRERSFPREVMREGVEILRAIDSTPSE